MSSTRLIALVVAALMLAATVAACGGGDDDDGAGGPREVVEETFSGDHESIDSGVVQASLEVSGDGRGSFTGDLRGPFQARGDGTPRFDLDLKAAERGDGGFDLEGGVISTGEGGFVEYDGRSYEVPGQILSLVTSYLEDLQGEKGEDDVAARLGLDPEGWLVDLKDEGTADVGGTETDHVSGKVDVPELSKDLDRLERRIDSVLGSGLDFRIRGSERLGELVSDASFELFSGTEDRIVRRFTVAADLEPRAGREATLELDFRLSEVNEPQEIKAPSGARPFDALLRRLGLLDELRLFGGLGVGGLEDLFGGGGSKGGSGSGSNGSKGGSGGGSDSGGVAGGSVDQDYLECLQTADDPIADCRDVLREDD